MKNKKLKKILLSIIIIKILLLFPFNGILYGQVCAKDDKTVEIAGPAFREILSSFITLIDTIITGEDSGTIEYNLYEFEEEIDENSFDTSEMMQTCQNIALYMKEHNFEYGFQWSTSYKSGTRQACCASYVSWVLLDMGLINEKQFNTSVLGDGNVGKVPKSQGLTFRPKQGLWKVLDNDSRWERFIAEDDSDLKPGDIQIYESNKPGSGHINIYAGIINGQHRYWDAGNGRNGAFKGITKTFTPINRSDSRYTCSYRLKN